MEKEKFCPNGTGLPGGKPLQKYTHLFKCSVCARGMCVHLSERACFVCLYQFWVHTHMRVYVCECPVRANACLGAQMYMCVYVRVCVFTCVPEEALIPQNWNYDCEPFCGCWEPNSGPLQEQSVLLTAEPSLQPWSRVFSQAE